MLGRVLDYSDNTGEGIITGEDGVRYTFAAAEWKDSNSEPARGKRVDFVGESDLAYAIYPAAGAGATSGGSTDLAEFFRRLTAPGTGAVGETVEPTRRFLAFLVEIGIGLMVNFVVSLIILIPLGASVFAIGYGAVLAWLFLGCIITMAVMFTYYWLMYTRKGAGAGHLLIGARPVDAATGDSMSLQQATTRAGTAALPWFFFGGAWMLGLWALFQIANGLLVIMNDDRRNLYDRVAGTRVVNARDRTNSTGEV